MAFLSRSNCPLISWLQSPSAVILEPKRKSVTTSTVSPSICHEIMGPDTMVLVFLIFSFKPTLSLCSFTLIKRLFRSSFLLLEWYHLHIWGFWCFSCLSGFQLVTHLARHFSRCAQCIGQINRLTALSYSFLNPKPTSCSIQGSDFCFLACIWVSQKTGKMVWYFHLFKSFPQFAMIHTVKSFSIVHETEVDVCLELPCFLYNPANVHNLISGSSLF